MASGHVEQTVTVTQPGLEFRRASTRLESFLLEELDVFAEFPPHLQIEFMLFRFYRSGSSR